MTPPSSTHARKAGAAAGQPLLQALGAFQQGRPADCAKLCEAILAKRPKEPGALHLQGVARLRLGDSDGAVRALRQAAQYDPRNAEIHKNLGAALRAAGDMTAAVESLRQAIALNSNTAAAHYNLGNALADLGRHEEAVAAYRQAASLAPADAAVHNNLGNALDVLGRRNEAIIAWRHSLAANPAQRDANLNLGRAMLAHGDAETALLHFDAALLVNPDDADTLSQRGVALYKLGRTVEAIDVLRLAIDRHPNHVGVRVNFGSVLCLEGRASEGASAFEAALAIRPDDPDALSSFAAALDAIGETQRAIEILTRALAQYPDHADSLSNMGRLLCGQGRFDAAIGYYERALAVAPDHAEAQFGHAAASLTVGRFGAGWRTFRSRPSMLGRNDYHREPLPVSLAGTTVQIDLDQGLGDEIFFLRFLPQLRRRGARVCYRSDSRLVDMLRRASIADWVVSKNEMAEKADLRVSVGDLPYLLGHDDAASLPQTITLAPLPERVASARDQLAAMGPPPYFGLTWRAGTRGQRKASFREIPCAALGESLRDLPGTWIALQRAPDEGELEVVSNALQAPLHDLTALNADLESMLATLCLLDDYICISNTNVHLRAACGGTCRILVPYPPEYLWMASGRESRWFSGTTVYRQTADRDWSAALAELRRDLAAGPPRRQGSGHRP